MKYYWDQRIKKEAIALRLFTRVLAIVFLSFTSVCGISQDLVSVYGYAINELNAKRLTEILVVNKRTGDFSYGDSLGNYSIEVKKNDELVFSSQGFRSVTVSLKDSVDKKSYFVSPVLNRYQLFIREVSVTAERKLENIKHELDQINVIGKIRESDYIASPTSPISFFYTKYNQRERRKQRIEQQKIADRKRILLEELFRQFMRYDNIEITNEALGEFIHQLDVSYEAINFSSEYQLLAHLKNEFEKWEYESSQDYVSPNPLKEREKVWKR